MHVSSLFTAAPASGMTATCTGRPTAATPRIAYFSMEYGLLDCMPIYSGGLGVLSGDHLKAASDCGFRWSAWVCCTRRAISSNRSIPDGWQQERTPVNDFYSLPVTPVCTTSRRRRSHCQRRAADRTEVYLKVWRIDVGRVKLYLLDSNIPAERDPPSIATSPTSFMAATCTSASGRRSSLGIGGLRALKALGIKPTVYHMNEGHSAFLAHGADPRADGGRSN